MDRFCEATALGHINKAKVATAMNNSKVKMCFWVEVMTILYLLSGEIVLGKVLKKYYFRKLRYRKLRRNRQLSGKMNARTNE